MASHDGAAGAPASEAPMVYQAARVAISPRFADDIFSAFFLFALCQQLFLVTQRPRLISQRPISAAAVTDPKTPDTLLRPDVLSTWTNDEN